MKRDLAPSEETAREEQIWSELGRLIARVLDKGALLQAVLEHTLDLTGLAAGGIYEVDLQTGQGRLFAHRGVPAPSAEAGRKVRVPPALLRAQAPAVWEGDTAACSPLLEGEWGTRWAVPLVAHERVVGLLLLADPQCRLLSPQDRSLLATIGEIAGASLARIQFYEELELFRRTAEEALDAVGLADTDGVIRYGNRSMAALHGAASPEQLIGRRVLEFLGGEDPERLRLAIREHLRQHGFWRGEVEIRGLDGRVRVAEASSVAHLDREGNLQWISTRFRDLTERRRRERLWRALEEAGVRLLRLRDADAIFQEALRPLEEGGLRAFFLLWNGEKSSLSLAAHTAGVTLPEGEPKHYPWNPDHNPTIAQAFRGRRALFVPDPAARVERGLGTSPLARAFARAGVVRSDDRAVFAPLHLGEEPTGLLVALFPSLTEEDAPPLGIFALQVAAALENARLLQQERERRRHAETLQRITAALASTLDLEQVLGLILEQVREVLPYDSANFMLPEGRTLRVVAGRGYPDWEGVRQVRLQVDQDPGLQRVMDRREVVIVPDTRSYRDWVVYPPTAYIRAWIAVPVVADGEVRGVLNLDFARPYTPTEAELALLESFAGQAGMALRNAALHGELRRLKELHERLFQEMLEGLSLEDAEGILTYVNPALAGMLERPAEAMVGQHWSAFVAPEDVEEVRRRVAMRPLGQSERYTARLLKADGTRVPCLISARPLFEEGRYVGTLAVVTDLSERMARERELQAAKEYLENLIRALPVGILRLNPRGEVMDMNPALEEMVGATAEERRGMNILEISNVVETRVHELYRRGLQGEPFAPVDSWYRSLTGRERYLRVQGVPIRDAEGKVSELVVIHEDLTAQRLLEERLQEAQKMDALSLLSRQVVHDFNNTLGTLLGYVSTLQMELPPDHALQEDLQAMARVIRRGQQLPEKLLRFASGGRFQPEPVNCNLLVEELLSILQRTTSRVELRKVLAPDLWTIQGDPNDLEHALMNLLLNAVEAMPAGGTLTVGTENETLDEEAVRTHLRSRPGPYVKLWVRDTGEGMDRETLRHIFEPFFSTRALGRGMGLPTVYNIVKRHGGFVEVQSQVGAGSTFTVHLPAAPAATPPTHPHPKARAEAEGGRGEVILVVEDELPMRRLLERRLRAAGYEVLCAGDGATALRLFHGHRDEIALVITDLVMPGLDGRGLCAALGRARPGMPVLVSTGRLDLSYDDACFAEVRAQFISKPYDMPTLLQKVQEMLHAHRE
ncbi:MAG: PAS domain S-box protein [Anaerolineae bacterium]